MGGEAQKAAGSTSSVEILSIGGFALSFAWMFLVFFWLFCEFPPEAAIAERDMVQLLVFAAVPVGYAILHFLCRNAKFNVFATPVKVAEVICAVVFPLVAFAMYQGVRLPFALICVANVLVGMGSAALKLSWLDVCSRLNIVHYSRFTGFALFAGGMLFVLVAFTPQWMQPLFAVVYIGCSMGLLSYTSAHAPGNDDRAPLESVENTWRFTLEIEPSFFMFGVVFGITFVFLFNSGRDPVMLGLISTLVGSLAVAILSMADRQLSITIYQRFLVVITTIACIAVPFVAQPGQIALSCVVTASWAMLMSVSYGYMVKKCVIAREAPAFRQLPIRLLIPSLGIAVGWGVAAALTWIYGAHDVTVFTTLRLVVAVLLVVTVMVFFPSREHHPTDGMSPDGVKVQTTVVAVDKTDTELFEERCAAVAKLYQLSPRETEILGYLARGRNAAYIQEELVISPHTVKSHIYNIYRKLDIHSQQKLMDFVEDFPLD